MVFKEFARRSGEHPLVTLEELSAPQRAGICIAWKKVYNQIHGAGNEQIWAAIRSLVQ